MAGPSQPQVFEGLWQDDRIDLFVEEQLARYTDQPFKLLLAGYRGLRAEDFSRYLVKLAGLGVDLATTDPNGHTLWQIIDQHANGAPYLAAFERIANQSDVEASSNIQQPPAQEA